MKAKSLRDLLIEAEERETQQILALPRNTLSFSVSFIRQMNEIIASQKKEKKKPQGHPRLRRVIAVIIAAALLIATAVTAVAFKEKLLDFSIQREDTHTHLTLHGNNSFKKRLTEIYLPTYIPEGFSLKSHEYNSAYSLTSWNNGEADIYLEQSVIGENGRSIDTEDGDLVEAVFGDQPVYYATKAKYNAFTAVWHTDKYIYDFYAPLDLGLEELEKIIASISLDSRVNDY